jgi:hypothetical protein
MSQFNESLCLIEIPRCGQLKEWSKIFRSTLQPAAYLINRKKGTGFNLSGSKGEGSIASTDQKLDKLVAAFRGGPGLPELHKRAVDTDLLPHLTVTSLIVGLSGIDMSGRTRTPEVGVIDLPWGTFLQKEFAPRV